MNLFIGFLTLVLVLDCLFLMLLVLVQLPKKEAGMGQAFGGGATDALFGPGSGNALTKLTKYAAGVFLVLCLLVSVLNAQRSASSRNLIKQQLQQSSKAAPALPAPAAAPAVTVSNLAPSLTSTNLNIASPAPAGTNAAGKK